MVAVRGGNFFPDERCPKWELSELGVFSGWVVFLVGVFPVESFREGSYLRGSFRDGSYLGGSFRDGSYLGGSFRDGSYLGGSLHFLELCINIVQN